MSESRRAVRRYVLRHPGSHFSAIVNSLDQATGQVQHHLSRLVRRGQVERSRVHGQTHYYPRGYDEWEKTALALLRRETTRAILGSLLSGDGQRPGTLASDLGLARSTIEYHLDRLEASNLVTKDRDENGRVSVTLDRPHETARLLATVDPDDTDRTLEHPV